MHHMYDHSHEKLLPFPPMFADRRCKLATEQAPPCPRCDSANTKFCYYNNYSLTQPRYFCKACRRYWTKGGSLRNVPVGGGCRKNRRPKSAARLSTSSSAKLNCSLPAKSTNEVPKDGDGSAISLAAVYAKFLNQKPGKDVDGGAPVTERSEQLVGQQQISSCCGFSVPVTSGNHPSSDIRFSDDDNLNLINCATSVVDGVVELSDSDLPLPAAALAVDYPISDVVVPAGYDGQVPRAAPMSGFVGSDHSFWRECGVEADLINWQSPLGESTVEYDQFDLQSNLLGCNWSSFDLPQL